MEFLLVGGDGECSDRGHTHNTQHTTYTHAQHTEPHNTHNTRMHKHIATQITWSTAAW